MTSGLRRDLREGVFWQTWTCSGYRFHGSDIAMEPPGDFRICPTATDSPTTSCSTRRTATTPRSPVQRQADDPRHESRRHHQRLLRRRAEGGFAGIEARRSAWVKCCDEVIGRSQRWSHIEILRTCRAARVRGGRPLHPCTGRRNRSCGRNRRCMPGRIIRFCGFSGNAHPK